MSIINLYKGIIESIEDASYNCYSETMIVKKAINNISALKSPENVIINTGFCHQKPYAFLVIPDNLYKRKKTELGDLMFVIKIRVNDNIIDKRVVFFQVKYDEKFERFKIEKHQLQFYSQIDEIVFKFGNNVYKEGHSSPIIWSSISKPELFGDYLLIGNGKARDVSTNCICTQYMPDNDFFIWQVNENKRERNYESSRLYKLGNPLLDFLKPFGKGTKIEGQFEKLVNLIYKKLNMEIDPPEENIGFWDGEKGFGVIEINYIENIENKFA